MKKLFVICSWALLLGGCKSESGASDPDGDKPVPPPSAELLQKIEDLNAGLVSLKTLAGAVSQSEVRSLAETEDGVRLTFCDGTEVTVACNAAAEAPLIGIAVDGDAYYWTLAAEKDIPWLKDAAGAKMPVSGPVPVVGRDDKGFWTVTTDAAVTPWQIEDGSGNPVEATGDEQVELFRSVKAGNGRVEIALTDGGTLSAAQVNDLSVAGTANCYVVSAPGTYVFNARVRGNGAGEGVGFEPAIEMADGMTADWLWTDSEGLVSGVALDTTSGDIFLTVGEGRGNALVALMQDGKVVWSWHVWVTDAPQTMTYGNGTVFMDRNLGAVGTTAGGTDAYGMYYQWGRKDPFYGGEKTETSANAFLEAKNGTVVNPAYPALDWAFSKSATTTDGAAANPMTFYNDKVGTGYNWLASPNATLWGEAKTLNDPCPPGYRVPETGAWEDLISGRQYIDGVSVWDGTNYGMTYTHGGQTAWYPALDWAFSKSATTTDGAAANPMTFYNDKVGTGYNWLASPNATLWGEAKTLNDPCPPGYRVPETGAWEDLISGRQYIDGVSVWDGTNYGMTYTHGGQTAWYPAQGYRNYSSGAIVGLRSSTGGSGAYWSAETSSVKSYYLFFRSKLSSSGSINNELDMNRSYGYTVRCCKE